MLILDGASILRGQLGLSAPSAVGNALNCTPEPGYNSCYEYGDYARLQVADGTDNCTRFVWTSTQARRLEDCFDLVPNVHW